MKPLTLYFNGSEYMAGIQYSKALDIRAHFLPCKEYGFKNVVRFSKLREVGEHWRWMDEVTAEGFRVVKFNDVVNDIFPNGYTWATFTKFLFTAFGADAFINITVSAIATNEHKPNENEILIKLRRAIR